MARYVVSLGGNALGKNAEEQKELLVGVAKKIVALIKDHHDVIIVHGNGPQVGMINLAFNEARSVPDMPFPECGAMSQGYIGFHLQNAIRNALIKEHIDREVATIITQVVVDENDPLFKDPTKPVGAFMSKEDAMQVAKEKGYVVKEDAGRGWRRVVPSPLPVDIIEKKMIRSLVEEGHIIITAGGGGIPVIKKGSRLEGVAAVIDKDYASAKVADLVSADFLIILTAVEFAAIHYKEANEENLKEITIEEAKAYSEAGYFAKGSMYPKIQACLKFLEGAKGRTAIISSLAKAEDAFKGLTGTIIRS